MKFVEVDREGNFKVKGDLRVLYSIMVGIRVHISIDSPMYLAKALTIGIRYGVLRRQFMN
jgi:hypothetical protein